MLKKTNRLRTAVFDEVFKVGKRLHTLHFQLIYIPSADFHAAAVVGKKVYKKAVSRNRLRRQMYGALYRSNQTTPLPFTFIIIAKPHTNTLSARQVAPAVRAAVTALTGA